MHTTMKKFFLWTLLMLLSSTTAVQSQNIKLSKIFSDGMVLQRETQAPIFGQAQPGTEISVTGSWDNTPVKCKADAKGRFVAYLSTPKAGGPYTITVNTETISNVLIGEVWLCSGQSNMQLALNGTQMGAIANDNNPNIRVFQTTIGGATTPQDTLIGGTWKFGKIPNNMAQVSAVGYYFARRLQLALNIPVGMINCSRGSTAAEEWMSPAVYNTLPAAVKSLYPVIQGRSPGCWYNAMIAPILPYKIAGSIWYQGENNVARKETYNTLLKAMVNGWRDDFKNPMLPFYLVQLPTFQNDWTAFREIQEQITDEIPNSGYATTIDVGDQVNIHPTNKLPVGNRLGDIALAKVYGLDTPFSSPRFREAKKEGPAMRVFFQYAEKGLKITTGTYPLFFEIAGADGIYFPAQARIEGNTVLVWADEIIEPVKVRYFSKAYAEPNLFSADNLPVSPFRMK